MTTCDELAHTCQELKRAYGIARASIVRDIQQIDPGQYEPEEMRDANGRFLLLDALASLANAQAAFVQASHSTHWTQSTTDTQVMP